MKSILITGASRGVGRSLALQAARSGYEKITLCCHTNINELEKLKAEISAMSNSECIISCGDISSIEYIESLRKLSGPVNVLINNAAISLTGLLVDMNPEEWSYIIGTNITSLYNTCHTFVPDMIREKKGRILNISSVWGIAGASCEVAYSATKGAVNSFTKALAKELAPSNIQVNAAALGIVDTEMNAHLSEDDKEEIREDIPAGYIMSTEDAANAIMKLLEMPPYFTGEVVKIDGGWI